MRVLVTGGAGFIGSAVCRNVVFESGWDIVVVDKLTYAGDLRSLASVAGKPSFAFERCDICDVAAINDVFLRYQPDAVVHLAAESHVDRSIAGSDVFLRTNVVGTFVLLEATRSFLSGAGKSKADSFRFLHVSTDEVYGSLGDTGRFNEETRYDPSSPYSATKAASDHLVMAWHRTYELPVLITNCSNNYGPYQFPEKLIPLTILNALEGKSLPVYGNGSNIRDWLYVDDHARALVQILKNGRPGETYNVGGGNERRNIDVVQQVCRALDELRPSCRPHERLISFVKDRAGHDFRYAIDATKLETELGWKAQETFEEGIAKTVRWYVDRPDWWRTFRQPPVEGARRAHMPVCTKASS